MDAADAVQLAQRCATRFVKPPQRGQAPGRNGTHGAALAMAHPLDFLDGVVALTRRDLVVARWGLNSSAIIGAGCIRSRGSCGGPGHRSTSPIRRGSIYRSSTSWKRMSWRQFAAVKLPKVRKALAYVRRQFRVEHPLVNQAFQTDGLDLLVERYGQPINASREGRHAMKEIIGVYLNRIEWDAKAIPIKLSPFTRDTQAEAVPAFDPRVVVMNPAISFGRR